MTIELRLLNAGTPPRALILGLADELLEPRVSDLVGDVRIIQDLSEVDEAEWDLLITDQPWGQIGFMGRTWRPVREGMCVLYRAPADAAAVVLEDRATWRSGIELQLQHVGEELHLPTALPDHIADLVQQDLVPAASARKHHPHFAPGDYWPSLNGPSSTERAKEAAPTIEPFLTTRAGACIAGRFRRSEQSEAWMLPPDVRDVVPWLKAALREWHALNPDRFLALPDWTDEPTWATAEERKAAALHAKVSAEREHALRAFDDSLDTIGADLKAARERASNGPRRLLTADGEDLVEAVQLCLLGLGFQVVDRDQARPGEKLEDLHVTDLDEPDWIALAEVKGFSKGVKTAGITQFLRFVPRFTSDAGRAPNALWYVVNHHRLKDPSTRGTTLAGADEDVSIFAAAGGIVIDTVDLFKLLQQVQAGDLAAGDARTALRRASGRLAL